jgi:hypothetical protein
MIAGAMREVDGIRILMFSSPWPSRSPVRNGFPNETLLGYQADEAGDHLHAIKRRPQGGASMSVYRLGVAPVVLA